MMLYYSGEPEQATQTGGKTHKRFSSLFVGFSEGFSEGGFQSPVFHHSQSCSQGLGFNV